MPHYRKTSEILAELRQMDQVPSAAAHQKRSASVSHIVLPSTWTRTSTPSQAAGHKKKDLALDRCATSSSSHSIASSSGASFSSFASRSFRRLRRKPSLQDASASSAPPAPSSSSLRHLASTSSLSSAFFGHPSLPSYPPSPSSSSSASRTPSISSSTATMTPSSSSGRSFASRRAKHIPDDIVIISRTSNTATSASSSLSASPEFTNPFGPQAGAAPTVFELVPGTHRLQAAAAAAAAAASATRARHGSSETDRSECPSLYMDSSSDSASSSCGISTFGELVDAFPASLQPSLIIIPEGQRDDSVRKNDGDDDLEARIESSSLPPTPITPHFLGLTCSFPTPPDRRTPLPMTEETLKRLEDVKRIPTATPAAVHVEQASEPGPRRALELFAGEARDFVGSAVPPKAWQNAAGPQPVAVHFFDLL
ncbi:uncharacterized protein PFL1_00166 [Pseudozyma flocculosa PF-1]|uniref:uncharacterized protein n=1 Tax=Pseudozyma flocculosa PF-1 TaxID=1277687 RepID=UPI0004560CF8|nr:uncharacterized protein PFL1_00166 [Pseudozyma flocculosa PF-1]EPQ31968.1 hypothetical protein PFL1_00166 [Pseudozyma flocculosa PF-1]